MLLFLSGFFSFKLGFKALGSVVYPFAEIILLFSFAMLLLIAVVMVLSAITREIKFFFRHDVKSKRYIWSLIALNYQISELFKQQQRQLIYKNQFKRQRLLAKDNRKQLYALYRAILHELQLAKNNLPSDRYKTLLKALRLNYKNADVHAMLALRELIH